jgi:sulfate adenylyltransferase subunit 1
MDDQRLIPGNDYWIKIGTKLLPAIVTGIQHKVDINTGTLLSAASVGKNEIIRCEIVLSEPAVLDEFRLHKTLGELILIDRVSHATAACGVIEAVGKTMENGVLLKDGQNRLVIGLFDNFYYHPEIHTVLRHSPPPTEYKTGDPLPLQSAGYNYPPDFDIPALDRDSYANIRNGIFIGFGGMDAKVPLLDANGIEQDKKPPRDFGKYRKVTIWEKDFEI